MGSSSLASSFFFYPLCFPWDATSRKKNLSPGGEQGLANSGHPAYGDLLIQGSIGDASNLIPMLASDSASHDISGLIFNGLVKYDQDLNLVGDLAESWEVSKDGLTITFKLRQGVKWQDGIEFTADDVLFGFKTIINPNTRTAYAGDFKEVKEAQVVDRYTFRVTYKRPFRPGVIQLGVAGCSAQASTGGKGHQYYAIQPQTHRNRSVPFQGMEDRGEDCPPGQSQLF